MDSIETIRNLQLDLAEIERLIAWMEESMEISQIDIDILLTKTRSQYNQILNLPIGSLSASTTSPGQSDVMNDTCTDEVEEEIDDTDEIDFDPETDADPEFELVSEEAPEAISNKEVFQQEVFEAKPASIPFVEPAPTPAKTPEILEEPALTHIQEVARETISFDLPFQPVEAKPQQTEVKETVAEAIAPRHKSSLNDLLGKKNPSQDVATSITETPVTDIWSAITINERFLFIRELFGNDPEKFKNTVTLLNSLGSWEAAQKFIKDRFDWEKNKPVANDFMNIIKRRFLR